MTRRRPAAPVRERGCARMYAPRLWRRKSTSSQLLLHLLVCPCSVRAYICISIYPSTRFRQLVAHNVRKTGRERLGKPRLRIAWWELQLIMSSGIPALPREWTSHQASSCHMTAEQKGHQSLNSQSQMTRSSDVVLPTMGDKETFIQLSNINRQHFVLPL